MYLPSVLDMVSAPNRDPSRTLFWSTLTERLRASSPDELGVGSPFRGQAYPLRVSALLRFVYVREFFACLLRLELRLQTTLEAWVVLFC